MITSKRIDEDLRDVEGLEWISALRSDGIRSLVDAGKIDRSLLDEKDLAEITDEDNFPGERLIVCRNPLLADKRARKREELLKATESANSTMRGSRSGGVSQVENQSLRPVGGGHALTSPSDSSTFCGIMQRPSSVRGRVPQCLTFRDSDQDYNLLLT